MSKINVTIGARPKLDWVDVNLIDVDRNYQRDIKPALVKKILSNFRWDAFGAVILSQKDGGRFFVTDGQHRVKAASLHPNISKVPATVVELGGTAGEAKNFLIVNRDRQAVSGIERYWAGITSKDPQCLHLARVLADAGCDVVASPGDKDPRLTNAVSSLHRAIKSYGGAAVTGALLCLREAWPKNNQALRAVLITSLSRLIKLNKHMDQDRLVDVLREQRFSTLTADAEVMRKISGGTAEHNLAKTLAAIYNKGIPASERLVCEIGK